MPAASPRLSPHERTIHPAAFVALMALLMSLQALAIDAMLPALDEIAADLGTANPNDRQLVVGVFLMAAGAFSLIPGALADRFGRRPVLFVSLGIYCAMSLLCGLVESFPAMIGARVLQALGGGTLARSEESWEGVLPSLLAGWSRRTLDKGIHSILSRLKIEAERRVAEA